MRKLKEYLNFSDFRIVKFLKQKSIEFNLPVLERKWSLINQNLINRYEKARQNEINYIQLKKEGLLDYEIAKKLELSKSTICQIKKRLQ